MSIFNSDLTAEEINSALKDGDGAVHFIGALGSGMLPLAELMHGRGYRVTGSDKRAGERGSLRYGFSIKNGKSSVPQDVKLAVYSLAIDESDAQILALRSRGVRLISRAQLLGALMSEKSVRVSVSGSHGKSTTTALIDHILHCAGRDPVTVSGATLHDGESYRDGLGDVFVAEACEYKDSFLRLCPTHQIITGVELDHTDYFHSLNDIRSSFLKAASMAQTAIINADDKVASDIASEIKEKTRVGVITYGKRKGCDYRLTKAERTADKYEIAIMTPRGELKLESLLIGEFNLMNITAAVALAQLLGVSDESIACAVFSFRGIERRLSLIANVGGRDVYYDYAHHPSEISAVIDALKERYGTLTVIFRPHTYSRTKSLWQDFITALSKADFTILLDIYPAREKSIKGITSKNLALAIGERAVHLNEGSACEQALKLGSSAIAVLGAGEVDGVIADFKNKAKEKGE